MNNFQLRRINSAIRLADISKFKPEILKVGDKWFRNNEGEVIKKRFLLKEYQKKHKQKNIVNLIFDIENHSKYWNQSRLEME
jgi:hypothetical protein